MTVQEFEVKEQRLIEINKKLEAIERSEKISLVEVEKLRNEALKIAKEIDIFLDDFLKNR